MLLMGFSLAKRAAQDPARVPITLFQQGTSLNVSSLDPPLVALRDRPCIHFNNYYKLTIRNEDINVID